MKNPETPRKAVVDFVVGANQKHMEHVVSTQKISHKQTKTTKNRKQGIR